jgi:hypothetical protein
MFRELSLPHVLQELHLSLYIQYLKHSLIDLFIVAARKIQAKPLSTKPINRDTIDYEDHQQTQREGGALGNLQPGALARYTGDRIDQTLRLKHHRVKYVHGENIYSPVQVHENCQAQSYNLVPQVVKSK